MKIRLGFVSNSSSSSFILILDRKPKSIEDVIELLKLKKCYTEFSLLEIAQEILTHINNTHPQFNKDLRKNLSNKAYENLYSKYNGSWEMISKNINKETTDLVDDFKKKTEGKFVTILNYSDENGGLEQYLEQGYAFENVEHIYVSHR